MNTLKKKLLNKETMSYIVFGILTTIVDIVFYLLFINLSVNYLIALVLAWCISVIFAFITNKIFVFKSKSFLPNVIIQEFFSFVSARIFTLVFSLVFVYLCVQICYMNELIAKFVSSVFVVILNYIFCKFYTFREKEGMNNRTFTQFIKENIAFIVSFVIPLLILIVVYYIKKIYPFGDQMYLRSDCYHQYAPFTKELLNKINNHGSLTYSWNIGLGVNFSALYSYYLASPINWFIGLFAPNHIIEVMNIFIIVKTALCSLTFSIYISKHFRTKKTIIASLSVFYALSSYFAAYSWNLMWLDCLVLLPLIILGLERLVKEDKCYLYCITLGFAILSNYYIAIMICIYCVLYFFALIYSDESKKKTKFYFTKFKNFALYSLLAGGFGAITVLPAYQALSTTVSGEFSFPSTIVNYFSVLDMLSRSLMTVEPAIFSAHDPNLYCTIAVFLLLPLYVINPKIKIKEKISKVVLVAIFLVSFNTNIPNYIWHGFHFPNSLPCRESFIYIFLILTMSYESLHYIKEITRKQLLTTFGCALALFLLIEKLMVGKDYDFMIIYLSITFLIFYLIVLSLFKSNNYKQSFVTYLLFVIVVAETFINTEETALSTSTRHYYLDDNKAIDTIVNEAKNNDNSFFRIEKYARRTKNDGAWNNYYSASTFSSTAGAGLTNYYGALGFEQSTNAYAYYGHTPLTESLFSIKYVIGNGSVQTNDLTSLYAKSDNMYLYKNNYTLPLGFMIPSNLSEQWDLKNPNPFEVQNTFVSLITNNSNLMFTRQKVDTVGNNNNITVEENTHLFIYVTSSLESISVNSTDSAGNTNSKTISSMKHRHILDLGTYDSSTTVSIASADNDVQSIQLYAYTFDENIFKEVYNTLNANPFEITKFSDTNIKGTINTDQDGLMYTSIPYDKGWTVYVDGKKVKTVAFKDALLAINLKSGKHKIELDYSPIGYSVGLSLTLFCTFVFVAIVTADYLKNKRDKQTKLEDN